MLNSSGPSIDPYGTPKFSDDSILLENRGFIVAQNFLLSLMSFKSNNCA